MTYLEANLVVLCPSLKAVLTAIAVSMIVWGQFHADRLHDDAPGDSSSANPATPAPEEEEENGVVTAMYTAALSEESTEEARKLQSLWRGPAGRPLRVALAGWLLLAVSSVVVDGARYASLGGINNNPWLAAAQVAVVLLLAVTQTVLLPLQVADQSVHENSVFFGCVQGIGFLLWAVLLSIGGDVPWLFSCTGAILVTVSWYVFWYNRKRGDSFDLCNVEDMRAPVFHPGGILLATGWGILWMSMNAINSLAEWVVPIYWTSRTQCALVGMALVVSTQWAVDYAHDEYVDPKTVETPSASAKTFWLNGALEIRIVYFVSWCCLAFTALLPTYAAKLGLGLVLFLAIWLQGFAISQQQIAGLRAGSEIAFKNWLRVSTGIYALIVILTGIHSGLIAALLSLGGIILQQWGRVQLHRDRKRGAHWMATEQVNTSFTVYSQGVLLIPAGMMLWAWGLSIP